MGVEEAEFLSTDKEATAHVGVEKAEALPTDKEVKVYAEVIKLLPSRTQPLPKNSDKKVGSIAPLCAEGPQATIPTGGSFPKNLIKLRGYQDMTSAFELHQPRGT